MGLRAKQNNIVSRCQERRIRLPFPKKLPIIALRALLRAETEEGAAEGVAPLPRFHRRRWSAGEKGEKEEEEEEEAPHDAADDDDDDDDVDRSARERERERARARERGCCC